MLFGIFMLISTGLSAQTVFDFDANGQALFGLPGESANESQDGDILEPKTATVGNFSITVSAAAEGQKTQNRIWNKSPKLRLYSGTMTIASAAEDIKSVVFTLASQASSAKWGQGNTASVGTLDAGATSVTWTGNTRELVISIAANTQISKITINGEGGETPVDPQPGDLTGDGTLANPYTPADAYSVASQMEKDVTSTQDYYIKGKISSVKFFFSAQYGTATFNISADGTTDGTQFTCYSVYYLENKSWIDGYTQIALGDEVIICGKLVNYLGTTPETASKNAYIYSLNGKTKAEEGTEPQPQPQGDLSTCAQVLAGEDGTTYRVRGLVTEIRNTVYGNFMLRDATGEILIYGTRDKEGNNGQNNSIAAWGIEVGDSVTVEGPRSTYKTTVELVDVTVLDVTKGGTTPQPVEIETISVEQALDMINEELQDGQTTTVSYYIPGFVVGAPEFQRKDDGSLYGNANFQLADEKDGEPTITVFRAKYFDNVPFTEETVSALNEGDEVVVCGKLQRFVKNDVMTPEVSSCYLYSINGQSSSIAAVEMQAGQQAVFNLQGQRVVSMQRGLYIIGGKKYLVK